MWFPQLKFFLNYTHGREVAMDRKFGTWLIVRHSLQGRTEKCVRPGQANNLAPFKSIFFKNTLNIYLVGVGRTDSLFIKIVYLFLYIQSTNFIICTERSMWKPELAGALFPIYSSDVLAPHIAWRPGQLPGWLAP
jgi:hypothetical protein